MVLHSLKNSPMVRRKGDHSAIPAGSGSTCLSPSRSPKSICVTTAMPTSAVVPATLLFRSSVAARSRRDEQAALLGLALASDAFSSASVFTCRASLQSDGSKEATLRARTRTSAWYTLAAMVAVVALVASTVTACFHSLTTPLLVISRYSTSYSSRAHPPQLSGVSKTIESAVPVRAKSANLRGGEGAG